MLKVLLKIVREVKTSRITFFLFKSVSYIKPVNNIWKGIIKHLNKSKGKSSKHREIGNGKIRKFMYGKLVTVGSHILKVSIEKFVPNELLKIE